MLLSALPAMAEPRHGLSAFGDLKYPADFPHFDYVNPDAPIGGRLITIGTQGRTTFDSLNAYILKGVPAQELRLLFDSLMTRAQDEPDAVYGLVAETADLADDGLSITFTLRQEAAFSNGTRITPADVTFSFDLLKSKGHPSFRINLRDVTGAEALDDRRVKYTFKGENTRDLPMIVGGLPILSQEYYTANEFDKTTLEPPLGSGPYRIKDLKQGGFITYQRRDDYWGWDVPVNKGRFNFGEITLRYYRDRTIELEALKAGELDLREEFTSKSWVTEYGTDAVKEGRLIKGNFPDARTSGAQGFFINARRDRFSDIRVREALGFAFDFEWTNKNLFFKLYRRTQSFFENSQLKAAGLPGSDELALLDPLRHQLPETTFSEPPLPPVSDGSGQDRSLLKRADQLLKQAGWGLKNRQRVNAKGEVLNIEFLIFAPTFERVIAPYVRNLKLLGIDATIRLVEPAQYQERLKNFDFDIIVQRFTVSQTPGAELRAFFESSTADIAGSFNLSGLKSPAIDTLINNVLAASSRSDLVIAAKALDRAIRAEHIWVPHWFKAAHNVAYWDIFGRPAKKPQFARAILDTWWIDQDKFKRLSRDP